MTTRDIVSGTERPSGSLPQGTIGEAYPDVVRIMLFVAFEQADAEAEPNYQQIIFTREAEPSFRLDCSRDDCAGGGFDFSPLVGEAIRAGESRTHGDLACRGRLGGGAGGQCCLKAEYRIIVEYD